MKTMTEKVETNTVKKETARELAEQAGLNLFYYPKEYFVRGYERTDFHEYKRKLEPPRIRFFLRKIPVVRYYLCGDGGVGLFQWQASLSKGVLSALIEAQNTHQFCRFEIWAPGKRRMVDPVLVGFAEWHPRWRQISLWEDCIACCRATYKICEWV